MIRRATYNDIPFLLEVARERYAQRFDDTAVTEFLRRAIAEPSMLVLRSEAGGAVASITRQFWGGNPRAYLLFVAARAGRGLVADGVRLVRAVDEWRRSRGAESLHFGEDTGIDFTPLARRLGAQVDRPSFVIRGGAAAIQQEAPAALGRGSTLLDRVLTSPSLLGGAPRLQVVKDR